MKCPFYISLPLCCAIWLTACTGPVIIEEPEKKPTDTQQNDSIPQEEGPDSVTIIHDGTYTSPYTIAEAQTLGRGKALWVEGYIVGCVSGSMKNGCNYTAEATTLSNILLADTFPTANEKDYLSCLPVELANNSIERDDLNLYDNPDNYHRKVRLQGDITLYYSVVGMKNIVDYVFEDEDEDKNENENENENDNENDNENEDENEDEDWDETKDDTLSIAEGVKLQSDSEYNQVYIKGYIIGYTTSNRHIYYDLTDVRETSARSNVVLADTQDEQDPDYMIAVELANGSYIQQAVNLVDNPENLHRTLTVKGRMHPLKGVNGCIDIPNGLKQENGTIIEDYYFSIE